MWNIKKTRKQTTPNSDHRPEVARAGEMGERGQKVGWRNYLGTLVMGNKATLLWTMGETSGILPPSMGLYVGPGLSADVRRIRDQMSETA